MKRLLSLFLTACFLFSTAAYADESADAAYAGKSEETAVLAEENEDAEVLAEEIKDAAAIAEESKDAATLAEKNEDAAAISGESEDAAAISGESEDAAANTDESEEAAGSCVVLFMSSAWGSTFQISGTKRISFVKNGSYYDVDRGVAPDVALTKPSSFYDREKLTEIINGLY